MKPLGPLRSKRIKKIVAAMRGARANELDDSAPERFIGMGWMKTMEVGVEGGMVSKIWPIWEEMRNALYQKSQRHKEVLSLKFDK